MSFVEVGSLNVGDKFEFQGREYKLDSVESVIVIDTEDWTSIRLGSNVLVEVKEEEKPMLGKFKQNLYRVTIAGKLKWSKHYDGHYFTTIGDMLLNLEYDGTLKIRNIMKDIDTPLTSFKFEKLLRCIEEVKQKENVISELLPILEGM